MILHLSFLYVRLEGKREKKLAFTFNRLPGCFRCYGSQWCSMICDPQRVWSSNPPHPKLFIATGVTGVTFITESWTKVSFLWRLSQGIDTGSSMLGTNFVRVSTSTKRGTDVTNEGRGFELGDTVDGSEILRSPVDMIVLSRYLQGLLITIPGGFSRRISEPSTYGGCHGWHVGPPAQKVPGVVVSNQRPRPSMVATKDVDDSFSFSLFQLSTHLKNMSQNGNLPQIGVKIENIWNHHPVVFTSSFMAVFSIVMLVFGW